MRRLLFSVLFSAALGSGLCSFSYGRAIQTAPNARAALPFAAPFALFSSFSAAALALSLVSLAQRDAL